MEREGENLENYKGHHGRYYGGTALLWFIVIVVVIWLILFASKPTWVQKTDPDGKPTGEVDAGKALLWAIVIAFFVCIIFWLFIAWGHHYHK